MSLKRNDQIPGFLGAPLRGRIASLVVLMIGVAALPAQGQQTVTFSDQQGFVDRNADGAECRVLPLAVGTLEQAHAMSGYRPLAFGRDRVDPRVLNQEYIFDGDDREARVQVDGSFNVYGLDPEDTIGHFDTLDGQRIVTPSNRVAIYAPRFASVRKVHGAMSAQLNQSVGEFEDRLQTVIGSATDASSISNQNLSVNRFKSSRRASGLIDRTRGVTADATTHLFGFRNVYEPYNSSALIRFGSFEGADGPVIQQGMQSALAWEADLGLQVVAKGVQPVITRDVRTVQELMAVESKDGTAILRVVKLASTMTAKTGEEVEFTIRFDNISREQIGNVTIIDNLTRRLEYVDGSSECSLNAQFANELNENDSLLLRWEITDPIEPGEGGMIRFRCRAR